MTQRQERGRDSGTPAARADRGSIDIDDLPALARGCAVMGAGGGGDPLVGVLMAREAIRQHGPVRLVGLDDLADDGLVMPCGLVGAPTIAIEKLENGGEGGRLADEVEALTGRPVAAIMPFEIGGANGLIPLTWAARQELPYVDADGMGRAFPTMPQMTMNLAGVPSSPCVMADERLNTLVIRAGSVEWTERLLRSSTAAFGGAAVAALYLMDVATARRATVPGSVSRALELGAAMTRAGAAPIDTVVGELAAVELIRGKIIDVERETSGGFVRGSAIIEDAAGEGRLLRLEIQNENLAALEDGEVRACVPDIITVLDARTGEAIVTERLRYGQRVGVIAFPGPQVWRTPAGLAAAGPAAFGLRFPYTPVDTGGLHAS
ncbi:DUF917 domain-containing protein [Pseudonocardia acidicola]|uniref:DUF917 domain-containing protein n=1 Tax=Pseudonocardia acidicola TaxID=2724939 RepID=A0ABX1S993_9PSEU|nr:DUF917 domain-containing protein [Pseudonocardia acidicola]NMH97484.1 DUF917 domain-containing protein [Pseudonocardia acidicola]